MYTAASRDQKTLGVFIMNSLKAIVADVDAQHDVASPEWYRGVLGIVQVCASRRETYYIADLLFISFSTWSCRTRQNLYAVLQFGTAENPSNIYNEFHRCLQNRDFGAVNGHDVLLCPSWNAITKNLQEFAESALRRRVGTKISMSPDEFSKNFMGLVIQSNARKRQCIDYYWNFLDAEYPNNTGEFANLYALFFYIIGHCSMSFNFTISRGSLIEICGQLLDTRLMPVPAITVFARIKRILKEIRQLPPQANGLADIDKLRKFLLFTHLGRNALPAKCPTEDDESVLEQDVFKPLEEIGSVQSMTVPKQFHLDRYPSPAVANGPVDGRSRNVQRYERYMMAYNSKSWYQQWFLVIYRDYTLQGTSIPSYDAVLQAFPDLIFFYAAKCLQRVSHGHAILILRNPLPNAAVVSRAGPLFGTRDILASPLHSIELGQSMEYIKRQSTHQPVQYNPGLLDVRTSVWKSSQDVSHDHYIPGRRIFKYASQGFIPYDASNFIERDMFNPLAGLRSRYLQFFNNYRRVILSRFNSTNRFYRNPHVQVVRLPMEDYFEEARRTCARLCLKWYILEVAAGQSNDEDYLFEPVIIIQDRDESPDGLEPTLERLSSREGLYSNLEYVICLDYEASATAFSTSSDEVSSVEDIEDSTDGSPESTKLTTNQRGPTQGDPYPVNFLSDSPGDWPSD